MRKTVAVLGITMGLAAQTAVADQDRGLRGIPDLKHVFVIMMENHGYGQIITNPNAPYINQLAKTANLATNYFAVGHPSLTNYLEVVGGSNFGIRSDQYPDWHDASCQPNIATGAVTTDTPPGPLVCPIAGTGVDAATPAVDTTNEDPGYPLNDIDGTPQSAIPAARTIGKTIADQLVEHRMSWKSYQESVPLKGPDLVNYSDGFFDNMTDFTQILPAQTPPLSSSDIVALYAAKHNPFVYFANVQANDEPGNNFSNVADFEGANGLFADLASGNVPNYSFIAPNQCNDQHGRGNAGPFCGFDPSDNGTQAGLNPALIQRGDQTVKRLVSAIEASPTWQDGRNAIVILWDENDYSVAPNVNQVPLIVIKNYGHGRVQSNMRYLHYSLLKTIEADFDLPCLNHSCDANVPVMSDLFGN